MDARNVLPLNDHARSCSRTPARLLDTQRLLSGYVALHYGNGVAAKRMTIPANDNVVPGFGKARLSHSLFQLW
jgi:hypothetical protein